MMSARHEGTRPLCVHATRQAVAARLRPIVKDRQKYDRRDPFARVRPLHAPKRDRAPAHPLYLTGRVVCLMMRFVFVHTYGLHRSLNRSLPLRKTKAALPVRERDRRPRRELLRAAHVAMLLEMRGVLHDRLHEILDFEVDDRLHGLRTSNGARLRRAKEARGRLHCAAHSPTAFAKFPVTLIDPRCVTSASR